MEFLHRFTRTWPRLAALALGVILALALMGVLELIFFGLNQYRGRNSHASLRYSRKFMQPDAQLGYKPIPGAQVQVTKELNGHLVYETSYAFDAWSRRITPVAPPRQRQKFIAFFGCSLTFGEGVRQDQTMPFYAGQLAPDYTPYNYGFSGYGPQQMLAKLQEDGMERELPEGSGVLVYTFFGAHIKRAIGSMQVFNEWSYNMPYYTLNSQNELVRIGSLTTGRPLLALFYRVVGNLQFSKYFQVDLPPRITEGHIRLTARIIEESCLACKRRFPDSVFCLVIYPGAHNLAGVIPELRQAGVKVLDYASLWDGRNLAGYEIEHDGHPTGLSHRELAGQIVKDLGLDRPGGRPE
jgi:hypothetical protein